MGCLLPVFLLVRRARLRRAAVPAGMAQRDLARRLAALPCLARTPGAAAAPLQPASQPAPYRPARLPPPARLPGPSSLARHALPWPLVQVHYFPQMASSRLRRSGADAGTRRCYRGVVGYCSALVGVLERWVDRAELLAWRLFGGDPKYDPADAAVRWALGPRLLVWWCLLLYLWVFTRAGVRP